MPEILVTGASGGLGRRVLPLLIEHGWSVRALSRRARDDSGRGAEGRVDAGGSAGIRWFLGDTVRGTGLAAAADGVDAVLHLAGGARGDDVAAARVAEAATAAGALHLAIISVIGADRMPIGYFRAKAGAELAVQSSGVPWSVLRAAQFHGFVERAVRALTAGPVAVAPRSLRFEPVESDEVARRLAELMSTGPAGRVPDLAGPEVLSAEVLVRGWLEARGRRRPTWRPALPGRVGAAYQTGDNLAGEGADRGIRSWAEHVDAVLAAERRPRTATRRDR